jgi:four helix bundle protein
MATAQHFEDLSVWQEARQLVVKIYAVSRMGAFSKDFGVRDQIRRAAVSTMSNIAEGFERGSKKEFAQFLNIAEGSNGEVRSHLYVALDQRYIAENEYTALCESVVTLSKRLSVFIRYLQGIEGNNRVKKPARVAANFQPSTAN